MKRAWAVLIACIVLCVAAISFLSIRPAHADPLPCGPLPVMLKSLVLGSGLALPSLR